MPNFLASRTALVGTAVAVVLSAIMVASGQKQALVIGVITGAGYGLVALGLVLIYKSSGVFNFAQGEFGTVAVYALYRVHDRIGVPLLLAMIIGLAAAVAMALATERVVIRPLFDAPRVTLLVATAGVALLAISLELWLGEARLRFIQPALGRLNRVALFGVQVSDQRLLVLAALLMLAVLLGLFFSRTNLGLAILGVSQEPVATELMGISVRRLSSFTWALTGLLAGIAGMLTAPVVGSFGPGFLTFSALIPGFTGAVLGGMTSLPGAFVGGVIVGVAQSVAVSLAGSDGPLKDIPGPGAVMVFVILVAVLAIRPQGLLGEVVVSLEESVDAPPEVHADTPVAEPIAVEHTAPPFRPGPAGWVARGVVMAAVAALVFLLPAARGNVEVHIFTTAVIYAIIGLSLNVLLGYTGQISLGHQAFVGIGAFTSAYMVTVHGQPFVAAVAMAMVVGALQALVLGAVSLRITGLYFALVTLAYGTMAEESLFNIQSLTGGSAGQPAPKPMWFTTDLRYYYLCIAFLAAVVWVDWRLMKTKGGRALSAVRENPRVAATFGTDVKVYTLMAFVVAGVFAGLGGALLAHNDTFVVRDLFNFQLALVFVIMTVIGGLRNRAGVVIGSAFFSLVGYFFDKLFSQGLSVPGLKSLPKEYAPIVIGPMLLLFTLTRHPGGVGQQIRPIQRWLRGGRFSFKDTHDSEVRVSDVRA